jgi:hypothetical protein
MHFIQDEIHPIEDTPLSVSFPMLCCCVNWPKYRTKTEIALGTESGIKSAILLGLKENKCGAKKVKRNKKLCMKNREKLQGAPILRYGFGIDMYLRTLM